ncbi:hypothetical protein PR202_gb25456 [Eleusine coracana subsp. coracana]|uniref:AAA+ ATPase domain-containing protein n=1 Tax=Eleusine coracana subsp. coracana TaxID=191504 RepID=A0AAV5FQ03_ELECO|nr:hypothetical protein PR202_gb25456 [Eleusine coracana subsp. coracana]
MQAAISAAIWVVGKALSPVVDGFLEAWAASVGLGPNVEELKLQLLYAQAMLNNTRGKEIENPALNELLHKLRDTAYNADDVLDELEYFRIQDALLGTYHAATEVDAAAGGCVCGHLLNAGQACRAVSTSKLNLCCSASRDTASSDEVLMINQEDQVDGGGCIPKVTSAARNTALSSVGKRLLCCFPQSRSANDGAQSGMTEDEDPDMPENGPRLYCCAWTSKAQQRKRDVVETPRLKFDRVEISRKMKDIVEQLKPICGMVSTILNLELLGSNLKTTRDIAMSNRPKTSPQIIEPKLYGRDDQFKSIVERITDGEYFAKKLSVLAIVGPGGIGKTTFAQHIYQEVKRHFNVLVWICVSLNFNYNKLVHEIVNKIPNVDAQMTSASEEELIEHRLKSKRFLLVLDDIWACQEDEWEKLLALLSKGGEKGSVVMVTTRILEVGKMVNTADSLMELGRLEDEEFMKFFEACAFDHPCPWEHYPLLQDVGQKIVNNLKGSPLAAKTVGRLLRNNLTVELWTKISESREWEQKTGDNDIMPALKLSYDYLPFHLQQCFSYCALFPEDYEFDDHITGALTVPMCSFFRSSLTTIVFHWNDELERFSMEQEEALQLLTSLKHLKLHGCSKLQCLPASLERLPNLKKLEIIYCEAIQSLPMEGFPSSLEVLHIILCRGISSLPKAGLPSSLQELYIEDCPAIRSLPKVERHLSSLLKLDVYESGNEELRRQCRKFKGIIPIVRA